jgi:hypothetical protein
MTAFHHLRGTIDDAVTANDSFDAVMTRPDRLGFVSPNPVLGFVWPNRGAMTANDSFDSGVSTATWALPQITTFHRLDDDIGGSRAGILARASK